MKKIIILFAIVLVSCTTREFIKIGGCQYIRTISIDGSESLTHKGDCNNPIHNNKVQVDTTAKENTIVKYYDLTKLTNNNIIVEDGKDAN